MLITLYFFFKFPLQGSTYLVFRKKKCCSRCYILGTTQKHQKEINLFKISFEQRGGGVN